MADVTITTALDGTEDVLRSFGSIGNAAADMMKSLGASDDAAKFFTGLNQGLELVSKAFEAAKIVVEAVAEGYEILIGKSVELEDHMYLTAQASGLSTEQFSQWDLVARTAGATGDAFTMSMRMLAMRTAESADGLSKASTALAALGITAKDPSDIMMQLSSTFSNMPSGIEKVQLAIELFGRASKDMIVILSEGPEEIQRVKDLSDALGHTLSDNAAKSAHEFTDNMMLSGIAVEGFSRALADQVTPLLGLMSSQFVEAAAKTGAFTFAGTLLGEMLKGLLIPIALVTTGLLQLITLAVGAGESLVAVAHGHFSEASDIIKGAWKDAQAEGQKFIDVVNQSNDALNEWGTGGDWEDPIDKIREMTQALTAQQEVAKNNEKAVNDAIAEMAKYGIGMTDAVRILNSMGGASDNLTAKFELLKKSLESQTTILKESSSNSFLQFETGAAINFTTEIDKSTDGIYNQKAALAATDLTAEEYGESMAKLAGKMYDVKDSFDSSSMSAEQYGEFMAKLSREQYPNAIAAADRFTEELNKNDHSFVAGVNDAMKSMTDWRTVGTSVYGSLTSGFGTFVDAVIVKGDNMHKALKSFFDSILSDLVDLVGKMIAEWALWEAASSFGFNIGSNPFATGASSILQGAGGLSSAAGAATTAAGAATGSGAAASGDAYLPGLAYTGGGVTAATAGSGAAAGDAYLPGAIVNGSSGTTAASTASNAAGAASFALLWAKTAYDIFTMKIGGDPQELMKAKANSAAAHAYIAPYQAIPGAYPALIQYETDAYKAWSEGLIPKAGVPSTVTPSNVIQQAASFHQWLLSQEDLGLAKPGTNSITGVGATGFADGGDFLVNRPSIFVAGEKGTERVMITPQNVGRGQGGQNTGGSSNVTINGMLLMDPITMSRLAKMLTAEMGRWK